MMYGSLSLIFVVQIMAFAYPSYTDLSFSFSPLSYDVLNIVLVGGETASECFALSRDQNKYTKEFPCCNIPYLGNDYLHTDYQHIEV